MYQYVIFDLDGTLLNTLNDLADAGNWVCRNHGWPEHSLEQYKYFVGNGMAKLVERFMPENLRSEEKIKQTLEEFMPYYNDHKADKTAVYAGIPQVLNRLQQAGVQIAVLTNKAHNVAADVVEEYYPGVFPIVQGALPNMPTKPDPTLLHKLMEHMGAVTENTLFVGDSNVDIRTAKNGMLDSCGVLWGFRSYHELKEEGATYLVETPEELADLILK